jgi:hypothetical protein
MKYVSYRSAFIASAIALITFSTGFAQTGRKPIVISPPAVPNGSNWSRAPFPSARQFDDVKGPDGIAIDRDVPPNTPATDPDPHPLRAPRVAIAQPRNANPVTGEPALLPTGRVTTSASAALDPARMTSAIRADDFQARKDVAADVESRITLANDALAGTRTTTRDMSPEGRAQFKALDNTARERERTVHSSAYAAARSTDRDWEANRTQLAADYEAYADAIRQIDTAIGVAPAR